MTHSGGMIISFRNLFSRFSVPLCTIHILRLSVLHAFVLDGWSLEEVDKTDTY